MEDSRYGMEVIYSGSDQDYDRTMRRNDTCNCYYAMHFVYSIYITSDKGPLIAQKFKFLHTVALNKNYDHIVQIDNLRSIHACHGETKKLKVMCLHSSDG